MPSISDLLIDDYDALPDTPAAEDLCPRAAAAAALQVAPTNEPARVTSDRFLAALKARGMRYSVTWRWNGRARCGVLTVYSVRGEAVFEREFFRNTALWTLSDSSVARMRTGSPKHTAVREALAHILALA